MSFKEFLITEGFFSRKKDPSRGMSPQEYAFHQHNVSTSKSDDLSHILSSDHIARANLAHDVEQKRNRKTLAQRISGAAAHVAKMFRGTRIKSVPHSEHIKAIADARADERGRIHADSQRPTFSQAGAQGKQEARNARRAPVIDRNAAKSKAKREQAMKDIPADWSHDSKQSMKAEIRGIRGAVKRWDNTQLSAMAAKMKGNKGMVATSTRLELKARAMRNSRLATKLTKTLRDNK